MTWDAGDVIGVAADLDARTLSFGVNGEWTQVFDSLEGSADGIYPSITMKDGACEVLLCGPFMHPGPDDDTYEPVTTTPDQVQYLERIQGKHHAFKGSFENFAGTSPLWCAAHNGHKEAVDALIELGASRDPQSIAGLTAREAAVAMGHDEIAMRLS